MGSTNDECGSSSKKTIAKRGVTRLPKIHKAKSNGNRIEVQWNARGQPVKHNSKSFASFVGVTVRRLVPISLDNWSAKRNKSVVDVYKENIWDEIQKAFVIGDEHREYVLREAGKLHRAFRTKIAKFFLKDSNGDFNKQRPAKYSYCIKQEHWDNFVAQRKSTHFQKLSIQNRERALNPQHPYRKSRLGCARLEEDMIEESENDSVTRCQVWKAARVNKDGVIDNDNVQEVVDECEKLTQSLTEEQREDLGPTDLLFKALNNPRNYSGSVRSYGFGVCSRDIFPRQIRPTQMDLEKLYGICNKLKNRVEVLEREKLEREKLETQQTNEVIETHQPERVVERQHTQKVFERQQTEKVAERKQPEEVAEEVEERRQPKEVVDRKKPSDKRSCNAVSFGNIPKGLLSVDIYLSSPSWCLVARGKLYNTEGNIVHDITLPPGYVKVKIEVSIVPNAPLPISVEYGDVSMVGQEIGTIVPWPLKLLQFVGECEKIPNQFQNKDKNIQRSAKSVSSPNKDNKTFKIQESPKVGGSSGLAKVSERQQTEKVAEWKQPEEVAEEVVERRQPKEVAERQKPSDKRSSNVVSFGNIQEGLLSVDIYLSSPSRCLVARGKLYNTEGNIVHGITLPPGYVKVKIEVSIVPNAPLPISVEYGDVSMVGQAIGTIVPWPLKLLQFVGECEKIPNQFQNKDKSIQRSAESVSSPNKNNKKFKIQESPKVGGSSSLANLPFLEMYTTKMMKAGSSIHINMEESIFGEEFLERLRVDNIKEIIDHNWLSASIITVFSRYLFDKFISPNGLITKFSFVSPHVSRDDNQGNAIAKILLKDKEFKDRLILAPCNIGKHWVLLVINPDAEMIYYMDPLNVLCKFIVPILILKCPSQRKSHGQK
ncbi:uncharacterized protein [Medicago truncatula]|uniref:uncharacterized protein isoform X4 n=1 Tax=Medicago truncatula TaxID=3880 RepID=UPI0019681672|nr:uncharacterized protein LOC112421892 isoform X4 [Medicago truncatula]